ncbi:hypothetical protein CC86DRAFT_420804 [Ophiobolus disseminans]|uniref:Uncharacterized protein n=1 Tax=Ophiobolus disseminans TaxID=1469910 RepID=A0A6A6ZUQ4_9PLEO|nr:hypothetical protein CC86DRAFT_420804 [Ophiobolus disseminans]
MHADWGCITKADPNARYCCRPPVILKESFDCAEAKCQKGEVQIDTHPSGSGKFQCGWGRFQVACCKTEAPPPPKKLTCPKDLCNISPSSCPDTDQTDDDSLARRDARLINGSSDLRKLEEDDDDDALATLDERGRGVLSFDLGPKNNRRTRVRTMNWPSAGRLFASQYRRQRVRPFLFRMRGNNCPDTAVNADSINPNTANPIPTTTRPNGGTRSVADTEHAIDRQVFQLIVEWMSIGEMVNPSTGARIPFAHGALDPSTMDRTMFADTLPASVGGLGSSSRPIREPMTRMTHHLGTNTNPISLLATEVQINQMKGIVMGFNHPIAERLFTPLMLNAATGLDIAAQERLMLLFRNVIGSFEYLRSPEVVAARAEVRAGLEQEFNRVANLDPGMYNAPSYFRSALYRHNRWIEDFAQTWMTEHIEAFEDQIAISNPSNSAQLLADLKEMKGKIKDMEIVD